MSFEERRRRVQSQLDAETRLEQEQHAALEERVIEHQKRIREKELNDPRMLEITNFLNSQELADALIAIWRHHPRFNKGYAQRNKKVYGFNFGKEYFKTKLQVLSSTIIRFYPESLSAGGLAIIPFGNWSPAIDKEGDIYISEQYAVNNCSDNPQTYCVRASFQNPNWEMQIQTTRSTMPPTLESCRRILVDMENVRRSNEQNWSGGNTIRSSPFSPESFRVTVDQYLDNVARSLSIPESFE